MNTVVNIDNFSFLVFAVCTVQNACSNILFASLEHCFWRKHRHQRRKITQQQAALHKHRPSALRQCVGRLHRRCNDRNWRSSRPFDDFQFDASDNQFVAGNNELRYSAAGGGSSAVTELSNSSLVHGCGVWPACGGPE